MKRRILLVLILALSIATVVFCALWLGALRHRSDLEAFARAEAREAYTCFLNFQEKGNEDDYWGGVAAFCAFKDAYGLLTENTNKSANHAFCNEVYGNLLSSPERSKMHISEMVKIMEILSENILDEDGYRRMFELRNALRY